MAQRPTNPKPSASCIRALGGSPAFLTHCRGPRQAVKPSHRENPSQHLDFPSRFAYHILRFFSPRSKLGLHPPQTLDFPPSFHFEFLRLSLNIERMFEPRLTLRRKAYTSLGYRMMSMYNICYSLCGLLRFGDNQALPPGQARHQRRRSRLSPKRLYKRPLFCRGRSPLAIAAAIGQNTAFCLVAQGARAVPLSVQ